MGILSGLQKALEINQKAGNFFEGVVERQENETEVAYERGQEMSNEELVDAVLKSGLFAASDSAKKGYYYVLIDREIILVKDRKMVSTSEFDRIASKLGYEKKE